MTAALVPKGYLPSETRYFARATLPVAGVRALCTLTHTDGADLLVVATSDGILCALCGAFWRACVYRMWGAAADADADAEERAGAGADKFAVDKAAGGECALLGKYPLTPADHDGERRMSCPRGR